MTSKNTILLGTIGLTGTNSGSTSVYSTPTFTNSISIFTFSSNYNTPFFLTLSPTSEFKMPGLIPFNYRPSFKTLVGSCFVSNTTNQLTEMNVFNDPTGTLYFECLLPITTSPFFFPTAFQIILNGYETS